MSLEERSTNHAGLWGGIPQATQREQQFDCGHFPPQEMFRLDGTEAHSPAMVPSLFEERSQLKLETDRRLWAAREPAVTAPSTVLTTDDCSNARVHTNSSNSFQESARCDSLTQPPNSSSNTTKEATPSKSKASYDPSGPSVENGRLLPPTGSRALTHSTRLGLSSFDRSISSPRESSNTNNLDKSASCWFPGIDSTSERGAPNLRKKEHTNANCQQISSSERRSMEYESQTIGIPSSWSVEKMEEHTAHSTVTTERKHLDDDSTIESLVMSPSIVPLTSLQGHNSGHHHSALGTPSTASTTPSTDFELPAGIDAAAVPPLNHGERGFRYHRRGPSWDSPHLPPSSGAWNNTPRIASFREEQRHAYPPLAPSSSPAPQENRWQNGPHQSRFMSPVEVPHLPPMRHHNNTGTSFPHRPGAYHSTYGSAPRKSPGQYNAPPTTPPRGPALPQRQGHVRSPRQHPTPSNSGTAGRSPSEVLKTLLRKKACLYEPDTSRAVALVTWLVGRELTLEYGFFSRQQLQAGVHACVTRKIEAGHITRTKVNRCMQIILNSCFHYIIPRPDGTEENGGLFSHTFANEVSEDSALLRVLPAPWNDVKLDREMILRELLAEADGSPRATPHSSPRMEGINPSSSAGDGADGDHKRAVLLCFNENVRCAEDVFRCHNEFIKDTAHASNLQLSSQEWRVFFGPHAAGAPYIWDYIGIPGCHSEQHGALNPDALGVMLGKECSKFRTSWCSKRYDHDHELCGFAHVEVNQGWLRRDPSKHMYNFAACPHIITLQDNHRSFSVNTCPHGIGCDHAHSREEIEYHPQRYKSNVCPDVSRGCNMGDICPHHHPADQYRHRKGESRGPVHPRRGVHHGKTAPQPSPMMYADPAPLSEFEKQLQLAGLQQLYRRQCAVICSHMKHEPCYYRPLGEDGRVLPPRRERGVPTPIGKK